MQNTFKTVVTENHTLTRKGYVSLLKEIPFVSVVGEAENGKELLKLLNKVQADIVLLDIEMPVMNGRETLKALKADFPSLKVIMLTFHNDEDTIVECIKLGACAFVSKECSFEEFVEVLSTVAKDGFYHHKVVSKALLKELSKKDPHDGVLLSDREKEIVVLACQGKSNKEIASILNIVVKTVDYHKANIYKKTNTHSTATLYNYALKKKLIAEYKEE